MTYGDWYETNLAELSNRELETICQRLNDTQRKCLGYKTPSEALQQQLVD